MSRLKGHFVQCFVAGLVAILPIAGFVATVVYFESLVAGSWLKNQGYYFFGMGLLILTVLVYLIGLVVSTFIGRWVWKRFDSGLDRLPVLGNLYQTLKQILGYGGGEGALFRRVVLVPFENPERHEIGLVTVEPSEKTDHLVGVFLPSAPTPTSGRFVYVQPQIIIETRLTASEAMQLLISMGTVSPDKVLETNS